MKVDFNVPMLGINGAQVKQIPDGEEYVKEMYDKYPVKLLSYELGLLIGAKKDGDIRKMGAWHKNLVAGKILEMDKSDMKKLEEIVEEDKELYIFFKSQILDILDNAK